MEAQDFWSMNCIQHTKEEIIREVLFCLRTWRIRWLKYRSKKSQKFHLKIMKEVGIWESKHCALTHLVTEWSTVTADWCKGLVPKDSIQALLYLPWEWSNGSLLLLTLWQQQHTRVIGFSSLLPRPENSAVSSQRHGTCTVLISCQYREHNCWAGSVPADGHLLRITSRHAEGLILSPPLKFRNGERHHLGHLQHHKSWKTSSSEEKKNLLKTDPALASETCLLPMLSQAIPKQESAPANLLLGKAGSPTVVSVQHLSHSF